MSGPKGKIDRGESVTVASSVRSRGAQGPGVSGGGDVGQALKKASSKNYDTKWDWIDWTEVDNKPSEFPPEQHGNDSHTEDYATEQQVEGIQGSLDAHEGADIADAHSGQLLESRVTHDSETGHRHDGSDARRILYSDLEDKPDIEGKLDERIVSERAEQISAIIPWYPYDHNGNEVARIWDVPTSKVSQDTELTEVQTTSGESWVREVVASPIDTFRDLYYTPTGRIRGYTGDGDKVYLIDRDFDAPSLMVHGASAWSSPNWYFLKFVDASNFMAVRVRRGTIRLQIRLDGNDYSVASASWGRQVTQFHTHHVWMSRGGLNEPKIFHTVNGVTVIDYTFSEDEEAALGTDIMGKVGLASESRSHCTIAGIFARESVVV